MSNDFPLASLGFGPFAMASPTTPRRKIQWWKPNRAAPQDRLYPRSSSSKRRLAAETACRLVADGDWQFIRLLDRIP
jgi:hypothetical protein